MMDREGLYACITNLIYADELPNIHGEQMLDGNRLIHNDDYIYS